MPNGAAGATTARPPLARATKLFYGFGSVAYGVKDNGFAFLLLIYYDQVLGLPVELASLAIFLALVVDALSDPLVGGISDRLHARWGRRHPFMYAAAIPVALSYYALWNPPAWEGTQLFVYLLVTAICVRSFITLFEVPSTALGPELTEDYDERTGLMALRYFFAWGGGIALSVLTYRYLFVATDAYPTGQLNPAGYQSYGVLAAAIMFIAMLVSALGTHDQISHLKQPPPHKRIGLFGTLRELRETLANRSFLALFCFALFAAMAAGVAFSMNIYMNTYFWALSAKQITLLIPSSFISAGIALAAAPWLSRRFGKRRAGIWMALAAAILAPVPVLLRLADWMPANGSTALLTVLILHNIVEVSFVIVTSTLVSAMMADVVEHSELRTGRRSEGTFFAARSFIHKSLTGLGLLITTALLTWVGFPEEAVVGEIAPETLRRLGIGYAPLVTLLHGTAGLCLIGYGITRSEHESNLARLRQGAERKPG